jgi:molecular chaperone GrpE
MNTQTNSEQNELNTAPTEAVIENEAVSPHQELEEALAAAQQNLLLAQADNQNLRRRHAEELVKANQYAISKFAGDLISVKDYLEMALLDQSGQIDTLKMGVELTLKQLISAFENAKISTITPQIGDKLNPTHHQAMSAEISNIEEGNITKVLQKGYLIADRLLRPASVVVAKKADAETPAE